MDARENPFQGPDVDDAPEWFNEIRMRGCVARITLAPASSKNQTMSESLSAGDLDSQQVPVDFQGNRVDVIHVNQTSAMLQRETETDQHQAILDRVRSPPQICSDEVNEKKAMEHRLPTQLRSPVAAMFDLQVQLPKKEQTKISSSLSSSRFDLRFDSDESQLAFHKCCHSLCLCSKRSFFPTVEIPSSLNFCFSAGSFNCA